MNVRFVIRKDGGERDAPWTVRDALCPSCETHDFVGEEWIDACTGICDCFGSQQYALDHIKWSQS